MRLLLNPTAKQVLVGTPEMHFSRFAQNDKAPIPLKNYLL